jgi:hypothetical protein
MALVMLTHLTSRLQKRIHTKMEPQLIQNEIRIHTQRAISSDLVLSQMVTCLPVCL